MHNSGYLTTTLFDKKSSQKNTMGFQEVRGQINWKVHFSSTVGKVFDALTTDKGRKTFWAEETNEKEGYIEFSILNYPKYQSKILERQSPHLFSLEYFGTEITFKLTKTSDNGTDLSLTALTKDEDTRQEMIAGWVSVLMAMKAAVDFGIDLRNHNPSRVWENGYLDN
jgi:uncharacterized protein YndB with AHSA1/START domain